MKQYLLFAWDQYYPCGGWNDFKGDFDILDDACKEGNEYLQLGKNQFHIIDIENNKIVSSGAKYDHESKWI